MKLTDYVGRLERQEPKVLEQIANNLPFKNSKPFRQAGEKLTRQVRLVNQAWNLVRVPGPDRAAFSYFGIAYPAITIPTRITRDVEQRLEEYGCFADSELDAVEPPDPAAVRVDAPADLGAARADRVTGDGRRRPSERRAGATRERCPQNVGIGAPACHDSGRMAGVTTRDPLDQNVSNERGVVGVECGRPRNGQIGNVG
jgi:hypothetical protein